MFKVILIDDEPLARENLKFMLQDYPFLEIIAECGNALDGIKYINTLKPDVIFLDIDMPRINGIEMLGLLDDEHLPYVIFVTAYNSYAIQAFEENAFDYILKPVESERLQKTVERLQNKLPAQNIPVIFHKPELQYIPCIGHKKFYLIDIKDIYYINSQAGGISVFTKDNKEYITNLLLKTIEEKTDLIRCHRQYLINLAHLKELRLGNVEHAEIVLKNDVVIPVSRRHLKNLKEQLGLIF